MEARTVNTPAVRLAIISQKISLCKGLSLYQIVTWPRIAPPLGENTPQVSNYAKILIFWWVRYNDLGDRQPDRNGIRQYR